MITIMIKDPNTSVAGPCLFSIVNFKNSIGYSRLLNQFKSLITINDTIEWKPEIATMDFEDGLKSAMTGIFPTTKQIGCLFHFKQALFRHAREKGMLKQSCTLITENIISSLSALSWSKNFEVYEEEFNKLWCKTKELNGEAFDEYFKYFENTWIPRFKKG